MNPAQAVIARERELSPPPGSQNQSQERLLQEPVSDEQVARQAGRGDPDAFAAIFRRYERDLYRFCVGILGEPQDAQDAIQNTMVKVLRALPGERRDIKLKPWLYRIAHNEAIELRRRRRPAEQLEAGIADEGLSVDERVERSERLRVLFRDMRDLSPRQRAALVMRELNGLEFAEIGDALGTSPSAVRQALYEARRGLQQMELGRHMDCEVVTRALSDEDGRLRARRDTRAHLRHCSDCRRFGREIGERKQTLAAISPLPALVAGTLLKSTLSGAGAGAGAGGAAAGGAGAVGVTGGIAAGGAVTSGFAKSVAGLLAVVAIGTAAADRGGLVDLQGEQRPAVEREATRDRAASGPAETRDAAERATTRGPRGAAPDLGRAASPAVSATSGERQAETLAAARARGLVEPPARTVAPAASGAAHSPPGHGKPGAAEPPGTPVAGGPPDHAAKPERGPSGQPAHAQDPEHPAHPEPGATEGKGPKAESGPPADGHAKPEAKEAKTEKAQSKAEAKTEKAQSKAEAKTEKAEARTEKAGPKTEKAEAKRDPKTGSQGAAAPAVPAPAESSPPPQPQSEAPSAPAEPPAAAPEVAGTTAESADGGDAATNAAEVP